MGCSKSSIEHLYFMTKKFILYPMAMKLTHLLLSNNKSVMRYSVFGILYHTQTIHMKQMTGEEILYQYLIFIMIPFTM